MSVEVKKVKSNLEEILNKVNYESLSGQGGAFLVTPLNKLKIFWAWRKRNFPWKRIEIPYF